MVVAERLPRGRQMEASPPIEAHDPVDRQRAQGPVQGVGVEPESSGKLRRGRGASGQRVGHAVLGEGAEQAGATERDGVIEQRHLGRHETVGRVQ